MSHAMEIKYEFTECPIQMTLSASISNCAKPVYLTTKLLYSENDTTLFKEVSSEIHRIDIEKNCFLPVCFEHPNAARVDFLTLIQKSDFTVKAFTAV